MAEQPVIEIREPGQPVRRVALDRAIEVGRECDGEVLADPSVSRVHLKLTPSPTALSVVDLGSRNGTLLNGNPLTGRAVLEPGDIIRLGPDRDRRHRAAGPPHLPPARGRRLPCGPGAPPSSPPLQPLRR